MKIKNSSKIGLFGFVLAMGLCLTPAMRAANNAPGPMFQYAVFYNGLLEFTDCASLTFNGPVHCNSNIYTGTPSGSTLTFNQFVIASGTITNAANGGFTQSEYTGTTKYNGTPTPGYQTGSATVNWPMNPGSYIEMINLPPNGESTNIPLSAQRYFNKADLVILVTNITTSLNGTNVTNVLTTVNVKSNMYDSNPLTFSFTNSLPTNTASYTNMLTNWAWFGASNWLSTNASMMDGRQGQTNHITQIDIGKFGTWIATNTNCIAKWNSSSPFNGIIYIADSRTTNGMYFDAARLTNGAVIPTIGASNLVGYGTNYAYAISGLSVATINPLYIVGNYNTSDASHCSVVCDALTLLSPSWVDAASFLSAVPSASLDTVNAAIIAGNVPSTGPSPTQFSGGLQNLVRLLELWNGDTLTLNTSFVNLYPSAQATVQFQEPSTYYSAPTRNFNFDTNFNTISNLPPGTPLFYSVAATVTLSNLSQAYDGTPKSVAAITVPAGLNVNVTYGTNTVGPTAVGNYAVAAIINDPIYGGVTTNLLVISKGAAAITLSNLTQTYSGTAGNVSVTTVPAGLAVKVTYNGSTNAPSHAGSYTVIGTVTDTNYQGGLTNTLVISQAAATVTLSNLSQTYDGTSKSVSVVTVPAGLAVGLTYNGLATAPTNAGSYTVIATVNDVNYQGSATNTLVIAPPGPGPINVSGTATLADGTFQLSFTNTPGTTFTVLGSPDPTVALTNWTVIGSVIEVSPGQFQFIDGNATNLAQEFYVVRSP